ncbi:histone-lysine N-methyltransferase KMT5B-like [Phymastichus coffea]|uniref:histone-lysine N-methyltransferase KMT5B-like n=1 Tax=Phymastichus coffea TaxID=108790 RepID=UPI00273AD654|nr:histone-lysine N-methyltransferase KMT5B-like [Phymastichus coffea]
MNAEVLINIDDLSKLIIVDKFSNNVRKINKDAMAETSKDLAKYEVNKIFSDFAKNKDIESLLTKLEKVVCELNLYFKFNISYKKWLRNYFKLYLRFFHPDSKVKLENCVRYSKEGFNGVKVVANEDIPAYTVMKNIFGYFEPLSYDEEKRLTLSKNDFSIIKSYRSNKNNIFLGSIAFINHDCKPNSEFVSAESHMVYLRTLKCIKKGQELVVYYSNNYFGNDNLFCECLTCDMIDLPRNETNEIVISQGDSSDSRMSLSHASGNMEDFYGFALYINLDKKLDRAYVKLEILHELVIEQYLIGQKNGAGLCIYCDHFKIKLEIISL